MVQIRHATVDDVPALVDLAALLFSEDVGVHDPHADVSWPRREGVDDFRRLLDDPEAIVLIAHRDGQVVGYLDGHHTTAGPTRQPVRIAVLRSIYVCLDARVASAGTQLTQMFLDWGREAGCVEAVVQSYARNDTALRLYERCGFVPRSITHVMPLRT